jgi:hypothetical protein
MDTETIAPASSTPAPAPAVASSPAPDLSGLVSPSPSAPTPSAAFQTQAAMQPFQDKEQAATQKAADLANQPAAVPVAGPHARLINMIQGLALGADSFGKSIATHGREGGVQEVQEVQQKQQQQKIQAQQAAQAQKNTQIQQQLMVADTNHKLAQNVLLMATLPNELAEKDLTLKSGQQNLAIQGADFAAGHGGMTADQFNSALTGTAPASAGGTNPFFTTNAKQQLGAATKILGDKDPYVQKLQTTLDDPKATPKDLWTATSQLQNQVTLTDKANKAAGDAADLTKKRQEADPLFQYQSDPKKLAEPGAQAALQSFIADPKNAGNLDGLAQAKLLVSKADIAQKNEVRQAGLKAAATKNAEMAATAGSPAEAGKLLAEGSLTLADLKSRGSSPAQIIAATNAAKDYAKSQGKTYNASDEITGEQALKGVTNQTFYGSARSLVQQDGMLDQLKKAHDALGNQKIPAFNHIDDWVNFQAGTPELTNYKQAVLAAADDYAKVMGGGNPNLEQFKQIKDGFAYDLNNQQADQAISTARNSVRSQVTGRIGTNSYINQREGDILHDEVKASSFSRPSGVSPQAILMQVPGGQPHWIEPQNQAAARAAKAVEIQ